MDIALTISIGVVLFGLGIWGLFRGVQRGMLSLVGTFVGVVLVDLWSETWVELLIKQFRPENQTEWRWAVTTLGFLVVAIVLGYGSSVLIPREEEPEYLSLNNRLVGGLIGILNGALVVGYLIHYTVTTWDSDAFQETLSLSVTAQMLSQWLPWFVLGSVVVFGIIVLVRLLVRLVIKLLEKGPPMTGAAEAPSLAGTGSRTEREQVISKKIDQKLN
ncbi:MAG: CvpA family protein [Chloroflexaceae bacterium]|nr:CvpA family protein [Chloroflexaceae bacterium]